MDLSPQAFQRALAGAVIQKWVAALFLSTWFPSIRETASRIAEISYASTPAHGRVGCRSPPNNLYFKNYEREVKAMKSWRFNLYTDEDRERFKDYLNAIPYNQEIDDLFVAFGRKEDALRKRDEYNLSMFEIDENTTSDDSMFGLPEDVLIDATNAATLRGIVKELPQKQRDRIWKYYWLEMKLRDIAAEEGVSINAIHKSITATYKVISKKIKKIDDWG